jgi:murein L,D-transpeptidase YafK
MASYLRKGLLIFLASISVNVVYWWWPEQRLPRGFTIDRIVVRKADREMDVYSQGSLVKTYAISLGGSPEGHKEQQGDAKTPEGRYRIDSRNANSGYHKNLGVSYPDKNDLKRAAKMNVDPGGQIKIHGLPNGQSFIGKFHRWKDWTAGCIAVTNDEMDDLYNSVPIGTPIEILP